MSLKHHFSNNQSILPVVWLVTSGLLLVFLTSDLPSVWDQRSDSPTDYCSSLPSHTLDVFTGRFRLKSICAVKLCCMCVNMIRKYTKISFWFRLISNRSGLVPCFWWRLSRVSVLVNEQFAVCAGCSGLASSLSGGPVWSCVCLMDSEASSRLLNPGNDPALLHHSCPLWTSSSFHVPEFNNGFIYSFFLRLGLFHRCDFTATTSQWR